MNKRKLKPGEVYIEVIEGCEGACLSVATDYCGTRVCGPKPWGGGDLAHQFRVNARNLIKEIASASRGNVPLYSVAPDLLEALKDAYPYVKDDALRTKMGALIVKAEDSS